MRWEGVRPVGFVWALSEYFGEVFRVTKTNHRIAEILLEFQSVDRPRFFIDRSLAILQILNKHSGSLNRRPSYVERKDLGSRTRE